MQRAPADQDADAKAMNPLVMWKQFVVCGANSIDKDEGTSCAEPGPAMVTLGGEPAHLSSSAAAAEIAELAARVALV